MTLLITDLDNTLYDWVTYFARSFGVMSKALVQILEVSEDRLLSEFKQVHQAHGSSEQPYATLELPCVAERFPHLTRLELRLKLAPAFEAFSREREQTLKLYPSVRETLLALRERGVRLVGHTEAIAENAYHRLRILGIASLFTRLYTLESNYGGHPDPVRAAELRAPDGLVRVVPRLERKPNPRLLLDICKTEGASISDSVYVGDSLTRDIAMAKAAGVAAVWAKYGLDYDKRHWATLVRVTHWTESDVRREAELSRNAARIEPDRTIGQFSEILACFPEQLPNTAMRLPNRPG